MCHV
jgi:hypothetical protein